MENGYNVTPAEALPIGEKQIAEAFERLRKYKAGKSALEERVVNVEEWWKSNHWERFESGSSNVNDPEPVSAWAFNSVANRHADFQDNYPSPAILPREESDEETAKILTDVIPVILERNQFDQTYSECSWDKPKTGTAIYGVFWNPEKENGLGDIEIICQDIMNVYWEPGIRDIQKSKDVFTTDLVDADELEQLYPQAKGRVKGSGEIIKSEYIYEENIDTSGKVQVIDWYYKKKISLDNGGVKTLLHYCKFIPGMVLYASENQAEMQPTGWYEHGRYPFIFDVMFPEKGSPAGFGYLDVMLNPQEYIDKLDQIILKSAALNKPRFFISEGLGINENEFTDLRNDLVHVSGKVDDGSIKPIQPPQLSNYVIEIRDAKIEELKETSGNRDFSQGSTASGVTAASAIAALQEAGSKLSRDMIKGSYTAYAEIITLVIELIRQFYDLPRCFRITQPNGMDNYAQMDNTQLKQQPIEMMQDDVFSRRPIFDVKVSAQKASPYSRIANNELAKELFGMGLFNPQIADQALAVVEMMDFDRRDAVLKKISENGTMYQKLQQMAQLLVELAGMVSDFSGRTDLLETVQNLIGTGPGMPDIKTNQGQIRTNSIGEATGNDTSMAGKARDKAATATEVR